MNVSGDCTVGAPREAVFDKLADPLFFASCFDGVSGLTETGPGRYDATFETTVAYMKFRFKMQVEMVRVSRPDAIEAKIDGSPSGMVGRLAATTSTTLSDTPAGTRIDYRIESVLAGKLGSLGQPVLKAKAREMERQFVERLRAAFPPSAPTPA